MQQELQSIPMSIPWLLWLIAVSGPSVSGSSSGRIRGLRGLVSYESELAMPSSPSPPMAKKVEHKMMMFGDERIDNYYWLRDDSRSNPEVLSYLRQENVYTELVMAGTKHFENQLFTEMKGRNKEDDISVPLRRGSYYYYKRNLEGKEYVQHCRRPIVDIEAPPSVNDTMQTGPDAPVEHVILDENMKAQEHEYYSVSSFKVSPNGKLVAYAEDTKGDEVYTIYVIDAETGVQIGKPLTAVTSFIEWAGDDALVYTTTDETLRPYKAWLHKLETSQSSDCCLYHEKDVTFYLNIQASESKQFVFVWSGSKMTSNISYLDISKPEQELQVLTPRVVDIQITGVGHRENHFFIQKTTKEFFNSELLACPVDKVSETTVLLPHRESVKIEQIKPFSDHLAVFERENGLLKATTYRLPAVGEPLVSLQGGQVVNFTDPIYSVEPSESQFSSSILRFSYSSLRTPQSVYDYDMNMGISVLKKVETVLGDFDASNYITERKWATAPDGTKIPLSIVYRKNLVKLDGSDPLQLYGYGSYQLCTDPSFEDSRLSLLDRGFIYAIAHVRGGGEMGKLWYENGKLLKKDNTFTDFIACAEYLIDTKYTSKEKLCIEGGSAGGLLIGAVLNMRPDLFKTAIAGVPFVDVVTTMLDPTIPLTTFEWEEWGDPRKEEFYFYMKSYSPVDNVKAQNYPNILVTAGLNDPRVMYSEPAKFVAKLRDMKTDDNLLLFKCELGAGHFSKTGRYERLEKDAFQYTFFMKTLNMVPADVSGPLGPAQ